MNDEAVVLDAYQVLLDGWVDPTPNGTPEHERAESARCEVETCLFRCITRQAFTNPTHLECLDIYGITLSAQIIPGAVDVALGMLAPLALNLDPRTAAWMALARGTDTFEWLGGIQQFVVGTRLQPDGDGWRVVMDGQRRKSGGVYYTPPSLVECLLDTSLKPLIDRALETANPEVALLALTVCDPSCGSGHFLVLAARRIARRLLTIRCGGRGPTLLERQDAMRDVNRRCIYAVDLDPMSVELAKMCLWLEEITGVWGEDPASSVTPLDDEARAA